jgi:hypothetical protein
VVNDAAIAEVPDWLLAVWPKVGDRRNFEHSPEHRRTNGAARSNLLSTPLPERQRNVGLTSIAGYLWNRCETLQELEDQLLDANAKLCSPPLPEDEVLTIARSISRYPKRYTKGTEHIPLGFRGQMPPSRNLFKIKRGSPPEDDQGKEPSPDDGHHYQGYVDECWPIHRQRRQVAIQQGRPDRLTGEIRRHWEYLGANTRTENADFYRRGLTTVKVCIAVENPRLATPDLEPLLVALLGEHDRLGETTPAVKRIRDCGRHSKWVCSEKPDEHWDGIIGQYQCTLHYCPNCLTDIAGDLDRARLPDIDPEMGAAYRSVWLVGRYPLPPDLSEWESTLKALQKTWEFTLVKLQRRKGTKGSILWRSFTAFYTEQEAFIHWKIMLKEDSPGAADGSIADLCQTMGAEPYDERRFVHGELASLQLVENARSHLLGFSQDMPWETKFAIFGAHYAATKGRHVFQGMGVLWSLLREAPKPEPPKCKQCDAPLRMVILRDEPPEEDAPVAGKKPTVSTPVYGYDPPNRPAMAMTRQTDRRRKPPPLVPIGRRRYDCISTSERA